MELISTIKVSVCVVTYNQEKYIENCIESIVCQSVNFFFEVIVSDDCSTDATRSVLIKLKNKYPKIIKLILNDKNLGPYRNFISTHNMASGNYVCHCDGDDVFLPGKLQKQADYLDSNPSCSVVWHAVKVFNDSGVEYTWCPKFLSDTNYRVEAQHIIRVGSVAAHSSQMYRRSVRITRNPELKLLDIFYAVEFLLSGYGYYINSELGGYRVNSIGSISSGKNSIKLRIIYADHLMYYLKNHPNLKSDIFIGAVVNMVIDAYHRKVSCFNFLKVACISFCDFRLTDIMRSIKLRLLSRINYSHKS